MNETRWKRQAGDSPVSPRVSSLGLVGKLTWPVYILKDHLAAW